MRRSSARTLHPVSVSAVIALALTGLLYGDALQLPLFSDDLVQIPWLESLSWHELWTTPSPYGYYRPLWYSLWRVWGAASGGLKPSGLHLLNLLAHATAAWLAGLLAAAWLPAATDSARSLYAALATLFFAIFPFARQAVAWPGAVYNPIVSALVAGAILAYDRARFTGCWSWLGAAIVLAGLAPFVYEAGLLAGPAVVIAEVAGWLNRRWSRRVSRAPIVFIALAGVTLVVWRLARGTGITGFGLAPADLRRNAALLAQGLIYPVAPAAEWLQAASRLNSELALWLVALPSLGLLLWFGWRQAPGALTLGIGSVLLFALPPAITMQADWFELAPRFLYMTAAGIALVWTAVCGAVLERLARIATRLSGTVGARVSSVILTALVVTALLAPAIIYVRRGMALYRMVGDLIWEASQAAVEHRPLLLVNLPARVTPSARTYPVGFEGITPLPKRVSAAQLVYVHTGLADAAQAVAFGISATETPASYTYELFGSEAGYAELAAAVRQVKSVYVSRYGQDRISLEKAGGPIIDVADPDELLARFGEGVDLLVASAVCGDHNQVQLTLNWCTLSSVDTDASVFVHLLDTHGDLVAQTDGYPLLGMLPFWLWEPGDTIRDIRTFSPVAAGDYIIRLGLWEPATGQRWWADGHPDGVIQVPVSCPDGQSPALGLTRP
jgi:hypothetical protein